MEYFKKAINQLTSIKSTSILLFFALFLVTACNNATTTDKTNKKGTSSLIENKDSKPAEPIETASIDYKKLADAYCACAEHTVSINNKLKKSLDSDDTVAFEALLPEADKAFKDAMECCRNAKFEQTTGAADQKKLLKLLKNTCSNLPEQLMLKMVTEIK
ncbi:MAG: hypothetical protein AB8F74_17855 [Saprospiraceae bacterium]